MSPKQNSGLQKRDIIREEAKRLFWSKGFDRTSIRDIAKASGCTQGNIYNHFRSKEDILYEALLDEMNTLLNVIQPLENDYNTNPVEELRVFIEWHVAHTLAPPKGELLHFEMEMRHLLPAHQVEIIQLRNAYDSILRKIIRRGVDAGLFAEVNEKLVNYAIVAMIVRARIWYSPEGEMSLSELSNAIFRLFFNGLRAKKDPTES